MHIDKALNLVIPIEHEDGTIVHVYSVPVQTSVFERYYAIFGKTFREIYSGGYGITAAPRIAAMLMRDVAKQLGIWDGPEGAERGLFGEMRRLTNVIALTESGWAPIPIHEAIVKGILDEDEVAEVDNAIAFFTVASHMHRKADRKQIMEGAMELWGGHLESSSYSEFCASLPRLTKDAASPPQAAPTDPQILTQRQIPM
jgi:hypothetical protein